MSTFQTANGSGRRRFLQAVGLAALGGTIAPMALAQSAKRKTSKPATPAPAPAPAPVTAPDAPPISDEAKALAGIVHLRYGAHLGADQLSAVTRELENRVQSGKRLRAVALANSDEPDTTFHA